MKRGDTVKPVYRLREIADALSMDHHTLYRRMVRDGVTLTRDSVPNSPWMIATHEMRRAYPDFWAALRRQYELAEA